jgi:hypothetical protein
MLGIQRQSLVPHSRLEREEQQSMQLLAIYSSRVLSSLKFVKRESIDSMLFPLFRPAR